MRRGMRERAQAVSAAFAEVLRMCGEAVAEMYEKPAEGEAGAGVEGGVGEVERVDGGEGGMKVSGADATFWDSVQEVNRKREAPIVKAFEKLSLLG